MTLGHLKRVVHRFLPRHNAEVNGWWMCDYGRFLADGLNQRDVERPRILTADGPRPLPWREAETRLAELLRSDPKTRVVASANHSNETLFLVKTLLVNRLGLEVVVPVEPGEARAIKNGRREWIRSEDAHPNAAGAHRLGLTTVDATGLGRFLALAEGPILVLDEHAHPWLATDEAASAASGKTLAVAARTETVLTRTAEIVVPLASWAEADGTYTSSTGAVQLAGRAFPPAGQAVPPWRLLHGLFSALGFEAPATAGIEAIYGALAAEHPVFEAVDFRPASTRFGLPVIQEVGNVG